MQDKTDANTDVNKYDVIWSQKVQKLHNLSLFSQNLACLLKGVAKSYILEYIYIKIRRSFQRLFIESLYGDDKMKKSFGRRIIAVMLSLCIVISMATMSVTTTSAQGNRFVEGLKDAGVDKVIELGVRGLYDITMGLSETMNEDAQKAVDSICTWVLMDASEAAIAQVQKTCDEILEELFIVEDKLTEYSADILSGIGNQNISAAKENLDQQKQKDITNVLVSKHENMSHVYNKYLYYFIMSNLLKNGYPSDEDEIQKLNTYLKSINMSIKKEDVTQSGVEKAKKELYGAFLSLVDDTAEDKENVLFTNKEINMLFINTIKDLSDKLEKVGVEALGESNVVDRAATLAYLALPYSDQQYEFVMAEATKQAMTIIILELAYGEFLAEQGDYLSEKYSATYSTWADKKLISYGDSKVSYNSLKDDFFGSENTESENKSCVAYAFKNISYMFSSSININTSAYNGELNNYETSFGKYMKPEDAVPVELTINSFEQKYNYNSNDAIKELTNGLECTGLETTANNISSENARFNRIMPGNNSGEVYYIIDSSYYGPLEMKTLYNGIQREGPAGGSDKIYGDFHVASMDYMNLMKEMTDGTNTYQCSENLNESLFNLMDTSAFGSVCNSYPSHYFSDYIDISKENKLLENDYFLDLQLTLLDGPFAIRDAQTDVASLSKVATGNKFEMSKLNFSGIANSSDNYTVIVANKGEEYRQKVALEYPESAKLSLVDGSNVITSSSTVKSGNDITLKIELEDSIAIKSLKCIRNNVEKTETVLIDEGEGKYFYNEDTGCYEFLYNMPYSDTTFILETERVMETDENGSFIIRNYDDLCYVAEKVNAGLEEYVNGSYILANDIIVEQGQMWTSPIGQYPNFFKGEFDGQGYTISGLSFEGTTENDYVGLFGIATESTIKNLNLKDIDFDVHCAEGYDVQGIGGLCAASSYKSEIKNCTVSGNITVTSDSSYQPKSVGGICGVNESNIAMEKCINYCNIDANAEDVGGICGYATNSAEIVNCANFGNLKAYQKNPSGIWKQPENCGGIIGETQGDAKAVNCYNVGVISGDSNNSSIVSLSVGDRPENCYYLDICAQDEYATSKTLEQFKSGEVAYLLNKNVAIPAWAWFQNLDNGKTPDEYPTLNFTRDNVVFKVDREDRTYSNIPNDYLIGDADLDSKVTIMDATIIQMHCAQLYELTGVALVNADTTKDNSISISDATKIQGYIAGILKEL